MGFEEAAPGETSFEFLQCEIGRGFLAGGAKIGLAVAAGCVEDVAGVVEQDAVFASRHFEGYEAFGGRHLTIAGIGLEGIRVGDAAILQFDHSRTALAHP